MGSLVFKNGPRWNAPHLAAFLTALLNRSFEHVEVIDADGLNVFYTLPGATAPLIQIMDFGKGETQLSILWTVTLEIRNAILLCDKLASMDREDRIEARIRKLEMLPE